MGSDFWGSLKGMSVKEQDTQKGAAATKDQGATGKAPSVTDGAEKYTAKDQGATGKAPSVTDGARKYATKALPSAVDESSKLLASFLRFNS